MEILSGLLPTHNTFGSFGLLISSVKSLPDRISIYGAALGLYNSRIVKLINKKKQLKSCVIIDELPTIFFKDVFIPFIKQFDCMRERTKLAAFIDF